MTTKTVPTPDEIWSILREASAMQKETDRRRKEGDRRMEELREEADRRIKEADRQMEELREQMKETDRRIDRRMKKTDRQIQKIGAGFNRRWGALVESLVEGNLVKALQERGIDIMATHSRSETQWKKPDGNIEKREFDIIAANGTKVVVVEVKTTLTKKDVEFFTETLEDFKNYLPIYKSKTIYGAMAYLKSENKAHSYAEQKGLFIIKATGDSACVVNKENFKPKVFS